MKRLLVACALVASACSDTPEVASRPRTLSSGRVIDVLADSVSATPGEKYLWFDFMTSAQTPAQLARELDEVWRDIQIEADRAGVALAFVKATDRRRRISWDGSKPVRVTWETGCATFRKGDDGSWRREHLGCCLMGPCHMREWAMAG